MGKVIEMDKDLQLKVTGIAKDVPSNSHLDFDLVIPNAYFISKGYYNVWINNGLFTYVQLDPHVSEAKLESRFPQFMNKYMGADMKKYGFHFTLSLTPLSGIYFEDVAFDNVKHGS